ncbi:MAG: GTP 3',8-cyclase MoaA [Deltaproteobacteria bacterium]|nr:GTP 3',8-cyclase MoaA [Deltaproteobacteria bacterium]
MFVETTNQAQLVDTHGRGINYLRLSITDRCNLRCFYCMPPTGVDKLPHDDILRFEEMLEVARAAVSLGVSKVRITGGEPLIKRGAVMLVREISAWPGVKTVAMTTNGTRLEKYVKVLRDAGLTRINVSLDSLIPAVYRKITRVGELDTVLRGIDSALAHGFPIKLNTVLIDGINSSELSGFIRFAQEKNVEVRFIERMSFEDNDPYVSQADVIARLGELHDVKPVSDERNSPHVRLFDVDGARIGFISPRSVPFCSGCNKLRLKPNGELRACLASAAHVDVRSVIRRPHTDRDLRQAVREAVSLKPESGPWTANAEMWRVGG